MKRQYVFLLCWLVAFVIGIFNSLMYDFSTFEFITFTFLAWLILDRFYSILYDNTPKKK